MVVKTFWVTTRTAPVPPAVITRLQREHNVTVSIWPADISSTLRRYNRDHTGQEVTIHAIDLFYVPPADPLPPKASYPWRLVLPLKIGSLDSTLSVLPALNISVSDIDFLYRPRYHSVIEALALMHTTADPALNATGFCHDDIKLDNIFLRNSTHEMFLGDMGQTRPLVHRWHKGWRDCRLVDAHRAWKSYLQLLREGSARDAEFDVLLMAREVDWARAYWGWVGMKEPTLPQEQLVKGFWGLPPVQTSMMFPVFREGRVVRVEMGREEAIAELERLRREILRYNKTASVGVRPWWWWDVPGLPTGGHHDVVNKELKVIIHEGGRLVGMPGT